MFESSGNVFPEQKIDSMADAQELMSDDSGKSPFPFLELPAEIRNVVYGILMTGRTITLYPSSNFGGFTPKVLACYRSRFRSKRLLDGSGCPAFHLVTENYWGYDRSSSQFDVIEPLWTIISTCSQIHREAHLLPYTSNTFDLDGTLLFSFLERRTPSQLRALGSLSVKAFILTKRHDFTFRDQMLATAEILTGLEKLKIVVNPSSEVTTLGSRARWIKGVEAWMGRGLKVGRVEMSGYEVREDVRKERDDFAKRLSERLTAG
jgi:hypothetical protein